VDKQAAGSERLQLRSGEHGTVTVSSFEEGVVVIPYFPKTIETSSIELSPDLRELVERLAENNHDHWAQKRLCEGWCYGPKRSDAEKTHPDLVPYGELSESEKEYDRKTVVEAIKAMMALGYDVKRR
jgi:hypothetical protein